MNINIKLLSKKKFEPKTWINSDFEELSDYYYSIKKLSFYEAPNYKFLKKIFNFSIIKNSNDKNH